MTDTFSMDKWNVFESSGRVADYLCYKGIGVQKISRPMEAANAEDSSGSCDRGKGTGGQ